MSLLNVNVSGGAWITASGIGCLYSGDKFSMPEGILPKLSRKLLSSKPEERWGRLDYYSKAGLVAASLALKDAGLDSRESGTTAVIASTVSGSFDVDHKYYETVIPQGDGQLKAPGAGVASLCLCRSAITLDTGLSMA